MKGAISVTPIITQSNQSLRDRKSGKRILPLLPAGYTQYLRLVRY